MREQTEILVVKERERSARERERHRKYNEIYRIPLWGDFVIIPKDSLTRRRNKRRTRKFFRCDAMLRALFVTLIRLSGNAHPTSVRSDVIDEVSRLLVFT